MEKTFGPSATDASVCNIVTTSAGGRKTVVIRLSVEQLLRSGQDTIEIHLDGLPSAPANPAPEAPRAGFFGFMDTVTAQLKADGKVRTAEAYRAALCSLKKFRGGQDFSLDELTARLMESYEAWLSGNGVKANSSSFYMRILKAVYHRAVRQGLTADAKPFAGVYTGNARTAKRAVDMATIRRLEAMTPDSSEAAFARDMFLFSFFTRGMSFVDMAYLCKSDLADGVLTYCRRKTGQQLCIRWEAPMQRILDRHPSATDKYLLPIIKRCNGRERGQYRHQQRRINEQLHALSAQLGLNGKLTMYVARHSWATIARDMDVPMSIISQGMGHDSERTTQIYLKEIDNGRIDATNRAILSSI